MKKLMILALSVVLAIGFTGCGDTSSVSGEKETGSKLSSVEYPYETAFIKISDKAYTARVLEWEYVSDDMIRVITERRAEVGDKINVYTQEFLLHESNIVFKNETLNED